MLPYGLLAVIAFFGWAWALILLVLLISKEDDGMEIKVDMEEQEMKHLLHALEEGCLPELKEKFLEAWEAKKEEEE